MSTTAAESIVSALIGLLEGPLGMVAQMGRDNLAQKINSWREERKTRQKLLAAAQGAEQDFIAEYTQKHENNHLAQAVASYPLGDNQVFQHALRHLTEHLDESFLAEHLDRQIAAGWPEEFSAQEIHAGVRLYLECLRKRLLKVEGYREIVTGLAIFRTEIKIDESLQNQARIETVLAEIQKRIRTVFPATREDCGAFL